MPRSARTTKIMNGWPKAACAQFQSRQSDGQVETSRPSASWIKIEHAANSLDPRPMRVAGNDHGYSARPRIELQFMDIVQDVDGTPAEPYRPGVRIVFRPVASIDVPSDRNHRRNPAQTCDDVWPTNITGVDDM